MRKLPLALALAALIALPASAPAFHEGNSGIDQYKENVPGAGDRSGDGGGKGSGGEGSALSPEARDALEAQGPLGAAAADLAEATAPSAGDRDARSGQGQGDDVASVTAASEDGSGLGSVLDAVFGGAGGGIGIALPIILAGGLLAALLLLLARRRGGSEQSPPA